MLILFERRHPNDTAVMDLGPVCAPMGRSSHELFRHDGLDQPWPGNCFDFSKNYYDFRAMGYNVD